MRDIDSKYRTTGDIIRKLDGSALPEDEPLILFRGRDRLLLDTLNYYMMLRRQNSSASDRLDLLQDQIDIIAQWQKQNPAKLRIP
ncbi:MAG TPA: hypothetical protein VMS08_03855 [Candidatus Saccharimonadia bacterium]|nr:hypothetical protein [Candidatus Saccharimonadia bacterium]